MIKQFLDEQHVSSDIRKYRKGFLVEIKGEIVCTDGVTQVLAEGYDLSEEGAWAALENDHGITEPGLAWVAEQLGSTIGNLSDIEMSVAQTPGVRNRAAAVLNRD